MGTGKRPNNNGMHNSAAGRRDMDLTGSEEDMRVRATMEALGHNTLSGLGVSGDIGQPLIGAEHESAPQDYGLPANQHVASSPEKIM